MTKTKTIALVLLVAIATIGAIEIQSAQACCPPVNPSTGNPHPVGLPGTTFSEPTGNPHQAPGGTGGTGQNEGCTGDTGTTNQCHGAQ